MRSNDHGVGSGRPWTGVAATVGAALLACSGIASAQQVPPLEFGAPITKATFVDGHPTLRDAATNAPLVLPRLNYPLISEQYKEVTTRITFQEQPSGYDVIYDMENTAEFDLRLGCLNVGIITMGLNINYMELREGIEPIAANANTYTGWGYAYPTNLYSPVFVLTNDTYAMGISLQYPILDYKHHVQMCLGNPAGEYLAGEGGRGWVSRFSLSTNGPEAWQTVDYGAMMKPGEKRRYVISVRVTKNPAEWLRTLVPYRNYFRSLYGGVRYERQDGPVMAGTISDPSHCSETNPLGWHPTGRPDLNGWSYVVRKLRESLGGWDGAMLWLAGGSYWRHPENNFPCWPASMWATTPALSTIFDPVNGMPSIPAMGSELGFWWGRSSQTSATWDPAVLEKFDPENGEHLKRGLRELDLMAKAGATMIGLDSFMPDYTPFWVQYRWMETMRLRYPRIKFVTEPTSCDIMHTLAATFITGYNQYEGTDPTKMPKTQDDCYLIKHPNYLADFLVPGHEYWASIVYSPLKRYFGYTPDLNRVMADMQRYASYGYRPCVTIEPTWWGGTIPSGVIRAAKTWETTVPADLQLSDAPIPFGLALSTGSKPSKSGGKNVVAGYRPTAPVPPSGARLDTSASGPRPPTSAPAPRPGATSSPTPNAQKPAASTPAERRTVINAARRARGLPPLPPDEPLPDEGSDVETFTNDGPQVPPATVPPSTAPSPKKK